MAPPYQYHISDPAREELVRDFERFRGEQVLKVPQIIHQIWIGTRPSPWQWIDTFRHEFIYLEGVDVSFFPDSYMISYGYSSNNLGQTGI